MELPLDNVVQIAGVIDLPEAELLIAHQVEYLGFPLRLKDGREDLSEVAAAELVSTIHERCVPVAITYLETAGDVISLCESLGFSVVQLHGDISTGEIEQLRERAPELGLFKSLVVTRNNREALLAQVEATSHLVDAYITDTFDPATGRSGATGKTHDWSVSRELVLSTDVPVILAGGLGPDNVFEAIQMVQPAAVDAHTGVEGPNGRKHAGLVRRFVSEAQRGFHEIDQTNAR